MSVLMRYRYQLVFPDGLIQDLETGLLDVQEGDLLSSEQIGITSEPSGKWLIKRIEDYDPGAYPHIRNFYLERF